MRLFLSPLLLLSLAAAACSNEAPEPDSVAPSGVKAAPQEAFRADANTLMADVTWLASDERQGRRTGAPEMAAVRDYITARLEACGVAPLGEAYGTGFSFSARGDDYDGMNLVARTPGTGERQPVMVLSAHYDHEGVKKGQIYNGADDNASGVAALMMMACYFQANPPAHDVVYAFFDGEELGDQGSFAFMANPPLPAESIGLNVNMDMVSRSDDRDIFAVGTRQFPVLKPYAEDAAAMTEGVILKFGFDDPDLPRSKSWIMASDHAAFYKAGIPFVYFGVEDHEDYHRPTDDADKIDPDFYASAVTLIGRSVQIFDDHLDEIAARRTAPLNDEG